jgi:hypothetical protein
MIVQFCVRPFETFGLNLSNFLIHVSVTVFFASFDIYRYTSIMSPLQFEWLAIGIFIFISSMMCLVSFITVWSILISIIVSIIKESKKRKDG